MTRISKTLVRLSTVTIVGVAALLWSGQSPLDPNAALVSSAEARIGRPLTPMSVAGVNRRAHRRAYRQGYYGYGAYHPYRYGYGTYQPYSYYGAGYGSYRPSYGYAYQPNGYRSYGYQPWWTR